MLEIINNVHCATKAVIERKILLLDKLHALVLWQGEKKTGVGQSAAPGLGRRGAGRAPVTLL